MGLSQSSMAESKKEAAALPKSEAAVPKNEAAVPKNEALPKKEAAVPKKGAAVPKKEAAMTKAKDLVAKNPVVVFSKSYCPYCVNVKKLLASLGANFTPVELNEEDNGSEIQSALAEWTGQRTVPNVFISGKHIGGCDDTTATHRQGKLIPLLQEAGAVAKA